MEAADARYWEERQYDDFYAESDWDDDWDEEEDEEEDDEPRYWQAEDSALESALFGDC